MRKRKTSHFKPHFSSSHSNYELWRSLIKSYKKEFSTGLLPLNGMMFIVKRHLHTFGNQHFASKQFITSFRFTENYVKVLGWIRMTENILENMLNHANLRIGNIREDIPGNLFIQLYFEKKNIIFRRNPVNFNLLKIQIEALVTFSWDLMTM